MAHFRWNIRRTVLHTILEKHFKDFVENYESKYTEECGRYGLERITAVVEEYLKCGDYHEGVARVKCTNPECNHDFFVPFSCKQLQFNSHWHGIIIEGGFDSRGNFIFIPIYALDKMTEYFRRRVIRFFLDKELITKAFASNLLSWKNYGFSIDASLRLYGSDDKTRESIAQYLVRPPLTFK